MVQFDIDLTYLNLEKNPKEIYWESILEHLKNVNGVMRQKISELGPRSILGYCNEIHEVDQNAAEEYPTSDSPRNLGPIVTYNNGNCLFRTFSKCHYGVKSYNCYK